MKLIGKVISRLLTYLYVVFKILFKSTKRVENGHILIIQGGNMGDAFIDAKSILRLAEYYTAKGKNVTVAGKNEVVRTLRDILGIRTLNYAVIEGTSLTFRSIKGTLSSLEKAGYEEIVSLLPWSNWPSLYIPACLPFSESWGAFPERNKRILKRILYKAYKNRVAVPVDMHQTQRNKLLLKELGISDFQTEIISLPSNAQELPYTGDHIVLSVDSKNTARRWTAENFLRLADSLLKLYPYDIYMTGVNVEPDVLMKYERFFAGNDRVKVEIGKLTMDEWVETIRGSRFVISLDSGAAHVAASAGVVCFCLTGVWDGRRIMPYAVDRPTHGTREPICVYRTDVNVEALDCYACVGKMRYGWGNKKCSAQCKKGQPCLCLSKLTVDDVMSAIEKANCDGVSD